MVDPVAFSLGPLQIRWYGILLAIGFYLGYLLLRRIGRERNIEEGVIEDLFLWLVPASIVGARLFEVVVYEPSYYFSNPLKIVAVWEGGLASHGGFLGALTAVFLVAKKHKVGFYRLADLVPVPFFVGAALGRVGNFINGELVGKVSSLPWAVSFSGYEGLRHPSQIYEALKNALLAAVFWNIRKINLPDGCLFWLGVGAYSLLRFVVEFWKDLPIYYSLTVAQWLSLPLVLISAFMFYRLKKRSA